MRRPHAWSVAGPLLIAGAAVVCVCATLVFGSIPDEEEFRFAVLSAWLYVREGATGSAAWTSVLGFGMPQPFVPNFIFHPLTPLLALVDPVTWVRALIVLHTIVGAAGVWRAGRVLGVSPLVSSVAIVSFLLAAPVQNYLLSDFWPSHYVAWTLAPWILVSMWELERAEPTRRWRWAGVLGLSAGVAAANANPAYLLVYTTIAAAVVLIRWRAMWSCKTHVAVAALLACAACLPLCVQLVLERQRFAPELALSNVTEALPWSALGDAFVPGSASRARSLFVGAPFAVLAVLGSVTTLRRWPELALGLAFSAVMTFTAWIPVPVISQRYQFRDPLTLCAILLAALGARWCLDHRRLHLVGRFALLAQVAAIGLGVWPYVQRAWAPAMREATVFRGAVAETTFVDRLTGAMSEPGRVLYSPRVDHDVLERGLVEEGLGVNSLAYRQVPLVNGSFKGVSTAAIAPDDRLFYGRIRTTEALVAADSSLDVLGIRYVIARAGETVAPSLRRLGGFRPLRGDDLVLYGNDDAWPLAFLVDQIEPQPGLLPECAHDRLLCRDLAVVAARRDTVPMRVARERGSIRVMWPPRTADRYLVVSEMFRPGWRARVNGAWVDAVPVYNALVGVVAPAGTSEVVLEYSAAPLGMAMAGAYAALIASSALIGWRPRASS